MPLEKEMHVVLEAFSLALVMPWEHPDNSPEEAEALLALRKQMGAMAQPPKPGLADTRDLQIPGPGAEIGLRLYTPMAAPPSAGHPVLVFFHGGGWVMGDLESQDALLAQLAQAAACAVVSVDYRLAPEHPFPAAPEDCYTATSWVAEHAAELGLDASRMAVGGESAGGNLAAAVALMARDRAGPPLVFQLLIYPVTAFDRDNASMQRNAEGYLLPRDAMVWFDRKYIRDDRDFENPYAAPLLAADLSGLPPAWVITAEYDPLHDEGAAYAARLAEAGVTAEHRDYAGVIHGFFGMQDISPTAARAQQEAIEALQAALHRSAVAG